MDVHGRLPCAVPPSEMRAALWGSLPCLSSGSEGPGEGTVQPLPTRQQENSDAQGWAGSLGAAGVEVWGFLGPGQFLVVNPQLPPCAHAALLTLWTK